MICTLFTGQTSKEGTYQRRTRGWFFSDSIQEVIKFRE